MIGDERAARLAEGFCPEPPVTRLEPISQLDILDAILDGRLERHGVHAAGRCPIHYTSFVSTPHGIEAVTDEQIERRGHGDHR